MHTFHFTSNPPPLIADKALFLRSSCLSRADWRYSPPVQSLAEDRNSTARKSDSAPA